MRQFYITLDQEEYREEQCGIRQIYEYRVDGYLVPQVELERYAGVDDEAFQAEMRIGAYQQDHCRYPCRVSCPCPDGLPSHHNLHEIPSDEKYAYDIQEYGGIHYYERTEGIQYLPSCKNAEMMIVPDISGYVGADTMGCILSTG